MWEVLAAVLIGLVGVLGIGGVVLCLGILFGDIPRQRSELRRYQTLPDGDYAKRKGRRRP